jgi:hypothetical protein
MACRYKLGDMLDGERMAGIALVAEYSTEADALAPNVSAWLRRRLLSINFFPFQSFATCLALHLAKPRRQHSPPNMAAQRTAVKTTYEVGRTLQPIYSGGSLALSQDGRILAASLGEDVLLTDLTNGQELGRVEGDGEAITALTRKYELLAPIPTV